VKNTQVYFLPDMKSRTFYMIGKERKIKEKEKKDT
jgi:hypothetical protein